jgi:hypothetical protein
MSEFFTDRGRSMTHFICSCVSFFSLPHIGGKAEWNQLLRHQAEVMIVRTRRGNELDIALFC